MDFEEKQRLNREQLNEFRAFLSDKVCEICSGKPFGITRTKVLCRKHYKRIVSNNKFRHEVGLDINDTIEPKDL